MKIQFLIPILFCFNLSFANKIDSLKTNRDVNRFLARIVDKEFNRLPILGSENKKTSASVNLRSNKFYKVDLDNNLLTDLVIDGRRLLIVLDKGNGKYELNYLDRQSFEKTLLVSIEQLHSPAKIIVRKSPDKFSQLFTLVYKYGKFIEFNGNPGPDLNIDSIKFIASGCFGNCPSFEMTINKDRKVMYMAKSFNDEQGEFTGIIAEGEYNELIELLNYIQIEKLNIYYSVEWTDDASALLTISYNNETKFILDYGQSGTYGLAALYHKFFEYRKSISWTTKNN